MLLVADFPHFLAVARKKPCKRFPRLLAIHVGWGPAVRVCHRPDYQNAFLTAGKHPGACLLNFAVPAIYFLDFAARGIV